MKRFLSIFLDQLFGYKPAPSIRAWRGFKHDMKMLKWRRWEKRWVTGG